VERPAAANTDEERVVKAALQWIVGNSALMVLALILAVLAWVVALEESDPTIEGRYTETIPVTLTGLPEGMIIVGTFDESVQVTIRAPQSIWSSLEVDDFDVEVDLTNLDAGTHRLPVQLALNKHPSRIVKIEPEYVSLEVENQIERAVPVHVQVEGEATLGYLKRPPIVDPLQVTVSGPSTYVSRVVEATGRISVQDSVDDVIEELRVQLRDSEGHPVPYVTVVPDTVNVHVPIEQSVYYRPLVVKVTLTGTLPSGYWITGISVDPPSVTVFGMPDVLTALPGHIETEPISLEGAQADVVERPMLIIPPNVSVVMSEQPVVRVAVEPVQSSLTVVVTPTLQGLGPGLTSTVAPETIELILSGPLPVLEALEDGDVRVVLDLFGLGSGTYPIEPQIVVPETVIAQSILPATLQVDIAIAPTPTSTEEGVDSESVNG
jgi:YbbR domain-containing protein